MKLKLKPILGFVVVISILSCGVLIGLSLYEQYKLNQIGFEVTRVEVDTTYDWRYQAWFRMYFYIEHDGEEKRVQLRLYRHEEHGDSSIDTRFWDISQGTGWVTMQFGKGSENETFQGNLYKLTAQRFDDMLTGEPISNEVTVWDGETSKPVLSFVQTFGIEVTNVEIGNFERRYGESTRWEILFYLHNHEVAQNITFSLKWEVGKSGGSSDVESFHIESGDNIIGLMSRWGSEPLDLAVYKLQTDKYSTIWYGVGEEEVEYLENENLEFTSVELWFNTAVAPPPLKHGLNESLGTEGSFTIRNHGEEDVTVSEIKIQLRGSSVFLNLQIGTRFDMKAKQLNQIVSWFSISSVYPSFNLLSTEILLL